MIGIGLLCLSLLCSGLQFVLPTIRGVSSRIIETLALITAFSTTSAFFALIYFYFISDFSFLNVALNSHSASQLIYKISGVWSNHEGSMMLWLTILTAGALVFSLFTPMSARLRVGSLQTLGLISFCFHLFVLLTSNPFVQLQQVPKQGLGMNPLLEDPSVAFHPPMLYMGLALLSIVFSLCIAGLRSQVFDGQWVRATRLWAMVTWMFLTAGIALGSWWAYYELGWGGWWFWDPVENISLLPWLLSTAAIHSLLVYEKTGRQLRTSLALGLLSFLVALLGLFLVRSGALTSVHAFALDPVRGNFLGSIALLFMGLAAWRFFKVDAQSDSAVAFFTRSNFVFFNALLLGALLLIVGLGTVYPLILKGLTHQKISIGAPYFNLAVAPFVLAMIGLMMLLPFVMWARGNQSKVYRAGGYLFTFSAASLLLMLVVRPEWSLISTLMAAAAFTLFAVLVFDLFIKRRNLSVGYLSMTLAHMGVAVVTLGVVFDANDKQVVAVEMKAGDSAHVAGVDFQLEKVDQTQADYYKIEKATFSAKVGGQSYMMSPEKRFYPLHEVITTESALQGLGTGNLYAVLGAYQGNESWTARLSWHPAVRLLWAGAALMILAALLSLYKKGLRMARTRTKSLALMLFLGLAPMAAADPLDQRQHVISSQVLCPTCQGQSIAESASPVAQAMRQDVTQLLENGASDDEVYTYLAQKYGEDVLLKPVVGLHTFVLWFLPIGLVFLMLGIAVRKIRFL